MATLKKVTDSYGKTNYYEVRLDSVDPDSGRRRQQKKRFRLRSEAVAYMNATANAINSGTYAAPSKKLLSIWLEEWIQKKMVEAALEQKTVESYEWAIQKINQHIGHRTLQSLDASSIEYFLYVTLTAPRVDGKIRKKTWELLRSKRTRLIKEGDRGILVKEAKELLFEEGYYEGEIDREFNGDLYDAVCAFQNDRHPPALGSKSLRHVYALLNAALKDARRKRLLSVNPMDDVNIPQIKPHERYIPDLESSLVMLAALKKENCYIPVLIALMGGLRRSEVMGLTWQDVNFDNSLIHIQHVIVHTAKKGDIKKRPKTASSLRNVAFPAFVMEELKTWKREQMENRVLLGPAYVQSDAVCTWKDGKPFTPLSVSDAFDRALQRKMLPPVTFHGLRHAHASMLNEMGLSAKLISERLGHSSVGTTMDVYTHLTANADRIAAEKLENIWNKIGSAPK